MTNESLDKRLTKLEDNFVPKELFINHANETKECISSINNNITKLSDTIATLTEIIRELQGTINNPKDGVVTSNLLIVEDNKRMEKTINDHIIKMDSILARINKLENQQSIYLNFKESIKKALWIAFTAIVGLIISIIYKH